MKFGKEVEYGTQNSIFDFEAYSGYQSIVSAA